MPVPGDVFALLNEVPQPCDGLLPIRRCPTTRWTWAWSGRGPRSPRPTTRRSPPPASRPEGGGEGAPGRSPAAGGGVRKARRSPQIPVGRVWPFPSPPTEIYPRRDSVGLFLTTKIAALLAAKRTHMPALGRIGGNRLPACQRVLSLLQHEFHQQCQHPSGPFVWQNHCLPKTRSVGIQGLDLPRGPSTGFGARCQFFGGGNDLRLPDSGGGSPWVPRRARWLGWVRPLKKKACQDYLQVVEGGSQPRFSGGGQLGC